MDQETNPLPSPSKTKFMTSPLTPTPNLQTLNDIQTIRQAWRKVEQANKAYNEAKVTDAFSLPVHPSNPFRDVVGLMNQASHRSLKQKDLNSIKILFDLALSFERDQTIREVYTESLKIHLLRTIFREDAVWALVDLAHSEQLAQCSDEQIMSLALSQKGACSRWWWTHDQWGGSISHRFHDFGVLAKAFKYKKIGFVEEWLNQIAPKNLEYVCRIAGETWLENLCTQNSSKDYMYHWGSQEERLWKKVGSYVSTGLGNPAYPKKLEDLLRSYRRGVPLDGMVPVWVHWIKQATLEQINYAISNWLSAPLSHQSMQDMWLSALANKYPNWLAQHSEKQWQEDIEFLSPERKEFWISLRTKQKLEQLVREQSVVQEASPSEGGHSRTTSKRRL